MTINQNPLMLGKKPSQRQLKVSEEIRQVVSSLLLRGDVSNVKLRDKSITITHVNVSPDLKNARLYIMPLGGEAIGSTLSLLNEATPEIRFQMAKKLNLKFVPNIKFFLDETFEQAKKIDELFHKAKLKDSK